MSLADARAEIAAALATVAGVTAFDERPDTIAAGSAWPFWRGYTRPEGGGLLLSRWEVQVCVGSTERAATDYVDTKAADLADALQPAGYVDGITPALFQTEAGDLYGLTIQLLRE